MADKLGSPFLQRTLNEQLTTHIRETLPGLRQKLAKQLEVLEADVDQFRPEPANEPDRKLRILMQCAILNF